MPRHDDDDDIPRRRRRPRDDEDDIPRRRRRRDEDEEDDRPRVRRRSARDQAEEDYDELPRKRRKKAKSPAAAVLGGLALVTGGLALGMSFSCFSGLAVVPGVIGLGLGIVGFLMAQKARDRQALALPVAGALLSLVATGVSVVSIISFAKDVRQAQKGWQEAAAKWEQAEAERKAELAKAPQEVRNATPDAIVRVRAEQFYDAWGDDDDQFDRLYKNKVVEVTGTFHEVNFGDDEDAYTVMLKGGADRFETVSCRFAKDPDTRAKLVQLRPGATVTIRGKCLGGLGPMLEACILVEGGG